MLTSALLIERGYFTAELPPVFNAVELSKEAQALFQWIEAAGLNKFHTSCCNFSVPKVGIQRRQMAIPNPCQQLQLAIGIEQNWKEIQTHYLKSHLSISIPEVRQSSKGAIYQLEKFGSFKEQCLIAGSTKGYELKIDIAKFYPSIYTHTIAWALHGRKSAKQNSNSPSYAGNQLDKLVRYCQENQTKGIPIGTDTSRIIAEIISCAIDEQFQLRMQEMGIDFDGYRFVDDCHFFFSKRSHAETALTEYRKILHDYSLDVSDAKTKILVRPCVFDNLWRHAITSIPLSEPKSQKSNLTHFANQLIALALEHTSDSVIKFGLEVLRKCDVLPTNFELFESLVLRLGLCEGSGMEKIALIIDKHANYFSKQKLEKFIRQVLINNVHKGHHYEISWALYIARKHRIALTADDMQPIVDSVDIVSNVILLDMNHEGLIRGTLHHKKLIDELDGDSLKNGYWLLAYEAEVKGWLSTKNIVSGSFFAELKKRKITFYNTAIYQQTLLHKPPFVQSQVATRHLPIKKIVEQMKIADLKKAVVLQEVFESEYV